MLNTRQSLTREVQRVTDLSKSRSDAGKIVHNKTWTKELSRLRSQVRAARSIYQCSYDPVKSTTNAIKLQRPASSKASGNQGLVVGTICREQPSKDAWGVPSHCALYSTLSN